MDQSLQLALEAALRDRVVGAHVLGGGDINEAYEVRLAGGGSVFVKTNVPSLGAMFAAEAHGLRWLAQAGALRLPEVLAVSEGGAGGPAFLALEYLRPARRRDDFDEELGRGLAALHRHGAPSFGLDHDNFIGPLNQSNRSASTWAEFYRDRRLGAQLGRAERQGLATGPMRRGFERLFAILDSLVGPPEPAARLHGDLWGGNLHVDERGGPCLIDPAAYGGHREVDLAMMKLFGGFDSRVFAAYHEAYPLAPGHEERVPLYQLYPLMVHTNLFGGGYGAAVERALGRYV
jgi:protein-ribulosamine 3-kinase